MKHYFHLSQPNFHNFKKLNYLIFEQSENQVMNLNARSQSGNQDSKDMLKK